MTTWCWWCVGTFCAGSCVLAASSLDTEWGEGTTCCLGCGRVCRTLSSDLRWSTARLSCWCLSASAWRNAVVGTGEWTRVSLGLQKRRHQLRRTTLWADNCYRSALTRVTSWKSFSVLRFKKVHFSFILNSIKMYHVKLYLSPLSRHDVSCKALSLCSLSGIKTHAACCAWLTRQLSLLTTCYSLLSAALTVPDDISQISHLQCDRLPISKYLLFCVMLHQSISDDEDITNKR